MTADDAAARSLTVEGLRRQLRGDLDTLVTKALKKDPAERYVSVDAMATDVRRFLAHEPIGARPDTFGYRAAKFVRRHRVGVALASLALIAALAGTAAILWQANEVRKQRDTAQAQLARATASSEFLGFLFSAAAPEGQKFVATDLLQRGEAVVDKQYDEDDPLRAELLAGIGMQHLYAQRFEKAQPVLERAEELGGPVDGRRASGTRTLPAGHRPGRGAGNGNAPMRSSRRRSLTSPATRSMRWRAPSAWRAGASSVSMTTRASR